MDDRLTGTITLRVTGEVDRVPAVTVLVAGTPRGWGDGHDRRRGRGASRGMTRSYLNREAILSAEDRPTEDVQIPEWGDALGAHRPVEPRRPVAHLARVRG